MPTLPEMTAALGRSGGNRARAARDLGVSKQFVSRALPGGSIGRPAKPAAERATRGGAVRVTIELQPALLEAVDTLAKKLGWRRSATVANLLLEEFATRAREDRGEA